MALRKSVGAVYLGTRVLLLVDGHDTHYACSWDINGMMCGMLECGFGLTSCVPTESRRADKQTQHK